MDGILTWFEGIKADFILNFIEKDRWLMLVKGLGNTLLMTTYATIIGVIIGIIIAVIRCTWDLNGKRIKNPLARGVLAVALTDDTEGGAAEAVYRSLNEVPESAFTAANYRLLKLAFLAAPSKVTVLRTGDDEDAVWEALDRLPFDWLAAPALDTTEVVSYIKAQRANGRGVKAVVADANGPDCEGIVNLGVSGLVLDDGARAVTLDGEPVSLTPLEYRLLKFLMEHPGRVFSGRELYQAVWKEAPLSGEGAVAVHIRHLREKLEIDPAHPRRIKVIWGHGYKLESSGAQPGVSAERSEP